MGSILEIAERVADDLSLTPPATLYGAVEPGDTTARRLRRAIERTLRTLHARLAWEQTKRVHEFRTAATELQPGAIPADFDRFTEDTIFDHARQLSLMMAETPGDYARLKGYPVASYAPRWIRRGSDILIAPPVTAGGLISFEYVSDAICTERPRSWTVVESTLTPRTLAAFERCICHHTHTVIIPALGDGESVELVPYSGTWGTIGTTIEVPDGSSLAVDGVDPDSRDPVSIIRQGAGFRMKPAFAAWVVEAVPTVDGMTLEVGKRYAVQRGQVLHVPVVTPGERIELLPAGGDWASISTRFVTRAGLTLTPTLPSTTGLAAIVATSASTRGGYEMAIVDAASVDPWSQSGSPRLGYGRRKAKLSADTDEPLWDDELVISGVNWLMNSRDGQPYGEDYRAFELMIYDRFKASQGQGVIAFGGTDERRPVRGYTPVLVVEG